MLKIITGGISCGGHERLKDMIRELTESGRRSYLIVPEQQTVLAEAEMSHYLPPSAPMYFEATNFTRLANTTFRALGGICGEYCTKTKKSLIMWRTLTELSPILKMTEGRREISAGLVERAMSAISDMQILGISAETLAEYSERDEVTSDKRLAGKISDLSRIYSLYRSLLLERYSDTADDIEAMAIKLEENPSFLSDTEFFIDGFTSFTEPQYKLISVLMKRCDITVYLALPKSMRDAFEYKELSETEDKLKNIARLAGVDIKRFTEDTNCTKKSDALLEINNHIFRNYTEIDNICLQNDEELRIFECPTPFDMCEFVASDIRRRVMGGAKYSDFAIVARDIKRYNGLLDTALSRANVATYISRKNDAESFEAIKLIYTAYALVRSNFAREDVMTYAKCGLSGISREEIDELETYVDTWQISGTRFTDDILWNMNPRGYSTQRNDSDSELLLRINETRRRLIAPIFEFAENARRADTVRAHAEVLVKFLTDIDLEAGLLAKAESLYGFGEYAYAEDNRKLWALICQSLDTLVEVSADMPADADAFLGQLKVIFATAEIGSIPSRSDAVTLGSADMLRLYGKKHVYMIGVNSGELPATATDSAYFSERDKILLSGLGLAIKPEMETRSSKELYFFSRAFSYAEESVTLLYCARDTAFKALERSEVVDRIIALTGGELKVKRISALSASDRLWSAPSALEDTGNMTASERSAVKAALIRSGHAREVEISERDIANSALALGKDICDKERERSMSLSQSRLDTFLRCPLSYFCKYTVKLSESSRAEFDAANIGSFIHSILENFFATVRERELDIPTLPDEEKRKITESAAKRYVDGLGTELELGPAHVRVKIDRLCRAAMPIVDSLCDEFSKSRFVPTYFEMSLGSSDGRGPGAVKLSSEGAGDISIYGIVDRVDTYKRGDDVYVRVVDYKTGTKEFSPSDIEEGKNLQMFLYLDAIVNSKNPDFIRNIGAEGGKLLPAGVIYHKSSLSDVRVPTPDDNLAHTAAMGAQSREGMVLADDDVIAAMGLEYTPLYSKRTTNKISDSKREFMFDADGWRDIMDTVHGSALKIADGIRSGDASAKPYINEKGGTACEYCEYKPICRKAIIEK
ncbi:MAG: PD-(D/E)XK nuclease family protein [Clostridia bacterium]|nr:PD-(D/E)XK nuclease family protein [Clostridia bacterium]